MKTRRSRSVANHSPASPANSQTPSAGPGPNLSPLVLQPVNGVHSPSNFSGLRNLELMHKFSTETFRSLSNDTSDFHVWQMVIPRQALEHDFLMSGVLAVAALHTATSIEPLAALSYIDTALEYHNMAFAPFRQALDHLTPLNCDAVFAHSIITTVVGIALPRLTATRDESSNMTENIIVVFELLQGVKKIFWISEPWLHTKLFTPRHEFWKASVAELDEGTAAALTKLAKLNDDSMANFDPEEHRINRDAIALLRRCFSRHANAADAASVLTWLAAVDKDFVDRLRRRKAFPLLILMHWGVLLGSLDGQMWWARNSGKALIIELLTALHPGVFQWEGAQLWPKQKMGL